MSTSFDRLIAPLNGGCARTKKELAIALLDITREDRLFRFATSLARYEVVDDNLAVLRRIAHYLSTTGHLHRLRLLSKRIAKVAATANILNGSFRRLYVIPMYIDASGARDELAMSRVAFGSQELVVSLKDCFGNHNYPPGLIFKRNAQQVSRGSAASQVNDWRHVFELCPNLTTLTINTQSCGTGMMWNRTSTALTALRTAFEEAGLRKITRLRMAPADMIYIGQFKWNGPAFGCATPLAAVTWSQVTQLELHILPLPDLSKLDRIQVMKMFNAWLRALAPRLQSLKLYYSFQEGEHPLALMSGLDMKARRQPNMLMPVLKELWLGRVRDVDDYKDLFSSLAPELECYHVLMYCFDDFKPVMFGPNSSKEFWRTVYLRQALYSPSTHSYHTSTFSNAPKRMCQPSDLSVGLTHNRQASASSVTHTHNRKASNFSAKQLSNLQANAKAPLGPKQHSWTTVSSSSERSSTLHTRNASSTFPPLAPQTSYITSRAVSSAEPPNQSRIRQTSLPIVPKRKRGSSGLSSIFKLKPRPKSEPANKPQIRLIGETPLDQVPPEFRGHGTNLVTLAESLAQYNSEALNDLTLPSTLRLADQTKVGQLTYPPGTLFQAGSGLRLPKKDEDGYSCDQPTPEQIRKAFCEKMEFQSPSANVVGSRHVVQSGSPHAARWSGKFRYCQREGKEQGRRHHQEREEAVPHGRSTGLDSLPRCRDSSHRSWETIEGGTRWDTPPTGSQAHHQGGRQSTEDTYEWSAENSTTNSKNMSQLEDVLEEELAEMRRYFEDYNNKI